MASRVHAMWSSHSMRIWSWRAVRAAVDACTAVGPLCAPSAVLTPPAEAAAVASAIPSTALRATAAHGIDCRSEVLESFMVVPLE